jgi:ATP-dependent RNA helicase DHX57
VAQPRRLAAVSVASRVSLERAHDGSVGYSIRGETKAGPKAKLLYCTTGVVLRKLASESKLDGVSHLIIDEVSQFIVYARFLLIYTLQVHERSVEIDLLLLEARELLKTTRGLKLILMSATIDIAKFLNYFIGAPVLSIPGKTFPVEEL